jgi:chitodextrinase
MPTDEYTNQGIYTWTCPSGVTSVYVEVWGGGGGGGGGDDISWIAGGGGGAGGYSIKYAYTVSPGSGYTVVVGYGGQGGLTNSDGDTGDQSYFASTSVVRAWGGNGGTSGGSGGYGGSGGALGTGDYREAGQDGQQYGMGGYGAFGNGGFGGDGYGGLTSGFDGADGAVLITYSASSDTTPPTTPNAPTFSNVTTTGFRVSWSASTDNVAVTGYNLQISTASDFSGASTIDVGNVLYYDVSGLSNSTTYYARVRAYDAAPNYSAYSSGSSQTTGAAADTTPPSVSISTPTNGSVVSGTSVNVTGTCSDNIGVVGVQLKVDGTNWGAEITGSGLTSFNVNRDTTAFSNGDRSLTAVARDGAGNTTTSSSVTMTVANGGGGQFYILYE